jgi:integrase
MKAKVVLLARLKTAGFPFIPVKIQRGQPVGVDAPVSGYYLRYSHAGKRVVQPVGNSLDMAFIKYQNKELDQTRARMGLAPSNMPGRVRIIDAVEKYLADLDNRVRSGERSRATLIAYRKAVETFRDHCGVDFIDQITANVLINHKTWLFENLVKRSHGKKINTVVKSFNFIQAFLSKQGVKMVKSGDTGLINRSDLPRESVKKVDKYSMDDIRAMLDASDEDEKDLIQIFVRTGARRDEIAHLTWADIDFKRKQLTISEKPQYGWTTKNKESRTLPLEDGVLLERLKRRHERHPVGELLFPNSDHKPDHHLSTRLHKIVEKATANGHQFEGHITLHRFRRTYASVMIQHTDLQTVQKLLAHNDISTTARYLAPDDAKARLGTRTAFKDLD